MLTKPSAKKGKQIKKRSDSNQHYFKVTCLPRSGIEHSRLTQKKSYSDDISLTNTSESKKIIKGSPCKYARACAS